MDSIVHADIFFFITSIAIVLVTCGVLILLYFVIGFMRDAREAARAVRRMSEKVESDFSSIRDNVKSQASRVQGVFDTVTTLAGRAFSRINPHAVPKRKKRTAQKEEV